MCGICGFIGNRPVSPECLNKMNDSMFHRGPDDSGSAMFMPEAGTYCGMAHRRLAVMDLSEKGRQPAFSPDKKVALVFNGEIYNFRQLRRELAPYPFQSDCDTEVVMAAWLAWGPECVRRVNGMFALAVYDSRSKELILARDRIGKKPLYYWYDKKDGNTAFVFASELKPVMMYPGFPKEIRRDIAGSFLLRGYINAPDTVFKDVYKLEPGGILRLRAGILEKTKYWDIAAVYHRQRKYEVKNYQKAKEELKARVVAAVKKRMLADVPLGCLLSGGYDTATLDRLGRAAPAGRFLYLASTLQKAAADLYYSANRRTDAELCLLRLCDESLSGDLTALDARIRRLEEAAARGQVIRAAVEQSAAARKREPPEPKTEDAAGGQESAAPPAAGQEDLPPWDEPPLPEEPGARTFDIPEELEPPAPAGESRSPQLPAAVPQDQAVPVADGSWWRALAESCKGRLPPMYRAFLDMCGGVLEGDQMTVYAPDDITLGRLENDRVRGVLSEEAERAAGTAVRLAFRVGEPPKASPQENLKNLLKFGSQFDNITIK